MTVVRTTYLGSSGEGLYLYQLRQDVLLWSSFDSSIEQNLCKAMSNVPNVKDRGNSCVVMDKRLLVTRHVGDAVSMVTEGEKGENRRCRGWKLGRFSLPWVHMHSDVTHPTPIPAETFLQSPNYKGVLSLSATHAPAQNMIKKKRLWFFFIITSFNSKAIKHETIISCLRTLPVV